jgi:hypothetical protein
MGIKSACFSVLRYVHAVSAAITNPKQPLVHIVLHPFVPYLKYAVPLSLVFAIGHFTCLDAMVIRMIADEDARRRHAAERQRMIQSTETSTIASQGR